ncbi:phage holin family protein [Amycolatopsis sp. FDAARGOS 1241]|uniref:phage holin family protein n=1 Tax=Amycolatopsis sp. FDAARGOS 1241 TaxID=2778070 RepID=UPI001950EFEC|nr:phage holin family protein [Amycolatopsis sp. FDAARGOS 1241]QRP44866.1 phage holin family protein [Amycolatopsis sp. FDAARGOS 1241]
MTTPAPGKGRLLGGGRVIARVILVWAAVTGVLRLLDLWLDGFSMASWWQPTVCALILGLLTSVVWPLVVRVAWPIAYFTLGVGTYLFLGAATLAILQAVPGVELHSFSAAVVITVVMSAVGAVISSALAVDEDEIFFRRAARRRRKHAPGTDLAAEPPGVIFLQIDGLGYDTVRRAVRDGDMPTFAAWLNEGTHSLTRWHTDWSSQTGASVCGILHGSNHDILGFRWYEKDRDHVMACAHPSDAAEIERRHSNGRGLLAGDGASHGNLFSGDAEHVSLTMSSIPVLVPRKVRGPRHDRVGAGYRAYFANPVNVLRTFGVALVDVLREISASVRQRRAGVVPRVPRGGIYPLARPGTTVIARDVVVSAIIGDMLAGRPVVYADFLGYDEVAHHSGIERFDTLEVLRSIDQQFARLLRASRLAPRRYHVVGLSDHGQTQGQAFVDRFGETMEALVGRLCGGSPGAEHGKRRQAESWQVNAALAEATTTDGLIARRLRARVEDAECAGNRPRTTSGSPGEVTRVAPGVVCVVSGHLAMVSFTEHEGRVNLETIESEYPDLLPTLVDHDGVGFMLVHSSEFGPVVLGRDGLKRLATGVVIGADPLTEYGPYADELIKRVDAFPHCADIMINSRYDPESDQSSPFERHVGSHGALGGPQQRGFILYPRELPAPGEPVGAEAVHHVFRDWLTFLGHPEPRAVQEETPALADVPEAAEASEVAS